jgi:formate dehydrogenase major subunit
MSEIKIVLNGKETAAAPDETILDVAKKNGIVIPTLCHDSRLAPFGACRVCLVKVEGARSFVPSCSTIVTDGMVIDTESPDVLEARRTSLSLLISDHFGDCVSPCSIECPAHIDIQGYIALISAQRYTEAVQLIKEKNPMPLCIGRICPHPCETVCRRNRVDEPIAINNLKRFAADRDLAAGVPCLPPKTPSKQKSVAVIGSGPAGLSCAYYLSVLGYDVTVFEKEKKAGGMLRWGIPEYRLPKRILEHEIESILDLGISIEYGSELGKEITIETLKEDGYSAVFLGLGAGQSTEMRIAGEDLPEVKSGLEFLYRVASGEKPDFSGKNVVVVGGGNTAMDASRTALRLGAESVTVLYRRTRTQMPANDIEIEEALEEGVRFEFLRAPVKVERKAGNLSVECICMELGEPDASGRRRPIPIKGSNYSVDTDVLITAIGQRPLVPPLGSDIITAKDTVKADPATGATVDPYIFAAGDCVTGAATAIEAIAGGRTAAYTIDATLNGKEVQPSSEFNISRGALEEIPDTLFALYEKVSRVSMPTLEASVRMEGFEEIEKGLSEEEALKEAFRCLECGCQEGKSCSLRDSCTEYGVQPDEWPGAKNLSLCNDRLADDLPPIMKDSNKCIKCGTCIRVCDEIWGLSIYGFVKRGFETEVSPYFGLELEDTECDFCGGCADSCPTGALSLKPFLPKPGPYASKPLGGRCFGCSLGCALEYNVYENLLVKVTSKQSHGENEGSLCVRGRFNYTHLSPQNRCLNFLKLSDGKQKIVSRKEALRSAVDMLSASNRVGILTSTSLSNEEYRAVSDLSSAIGAQLFHIPYDEAEALPQELPVIARSAEAERILNTLPRFSLEEMKRASTIIFWGILPGRSYPILEMKARAAVRQGARLFIINRYPTRLDETAEEVFRVSENLYVDILDLLGLCLTEENNGASPVAAKYYKDRKANRGLLAAARLSKRKITTLLRAVRDVEQCVWVTDEYDKNDEKLLAWLHLMLSMQGKARIILMNRGGNPEGAHRYGRPHAEYTFITSSMLNSFDTLLYYNLPPLGDLPDRPDRSVLQIGTQPQPSTGRNTLFIPSSSLLETGGTTVLYSGCEMTLNPVLKNDTSIDNIELLCTIMGRIKNVQKDDPPDQRQKA